MDMPKGVFWSGTLLGVLFAFEFVCLYWSLDLTTVSRVSVIFYSMPVWLSLAAHFLLPGEQLTRLRALGLGLAMLGVVVAVMDREGGTASLLGDVLALGAALGWGGIALAIRLTPIQEARPETMLAWQLGVSAPILIVVAALARCESLGSLGKIDADHASSLRRVRPAMEFRQKINLSESHATPRIR